MRCSLHPFRKHIKMTIPLLICQEKICKHETSQRLASVCGNLLQDQMLFHKNEIKTQTLARKYQQSYAAIILAPFQNYSDKNMYELRLGC